jgi:hypothetical protein
MLAALDLANIIGVGRPGPCAKPVGTSLQLSDATMAKCVERCGLLLPCGCRQERTPG